MKLGVEDGWDQMIAGVGEWLVFTCPRFTRSIYISLQLRSPPTQDRFVEALLGEVGTRFRLCDRCLLTNLSPSYGVNLELNDIAEHERKFWPPNQEEMTYHKLDATSLTLET